MSRSSQRGSDSLAHKVLRLFDLVASDDDVPFGVSFNDRNGAIITFNAEKILHAAEQ